MPFTSLHMGPGLAIKALFGRRFSVMAFGVAQVAMDIEPLVGMVRGADVLHGPTHTYLTALVIAAIVAVISPVICRPILRQWNRELSFYRVNWLIERESFSPISVVAGAFAGTVSHVILDSVMHSDITPFSPWSATNGLYGYVSIAGLHQFCIFAGVFGVIGWLLMAWLKRHLGVGREG